MWMTSRDLDFAPIRSEFELPPYGDDAFSEDVRAEANTARDLFAGERVTSPNSPS